MEHHLGNKGLSYAWVLLASLSEPGSEDQESALAEN